MKLKPDSFKNFYNKGKNIAKEAKNKFEEKISPAIEEAVEKAADWTDKRIIDGKEMYEAARQKAEPKVREAAAQAQNILNPPKLEVLERKMKYAQDHLSFNEAQKAAEKYIKFASQQREAQKAFDKLNNVNK